MKLILIMLLLIFININYKEYMSNINYKQYMSNINNTIDKIYVINLTKNKDRWDAISKMAQKANVNITRFDAIYGKYLSDDDDRIKKYFTQNKLNKSQIGCALSHILIWEDAKKNNYNNIIIFEDDAIIPEDFWDKLSISFNQLPTNWDMLLLAITKGHATKYSTNLVKPYKTLLYNGNWGLIGYLMNINFINKILPDLKLNVPIDNYLINKYYYNNKYNIFITNPLIIHHDYSFFSDNFNRFRKGEFHKNNIKLY